MDVNIATIQSQSQQFPNLKMEKYQEIPV
jgi:hypothetical protein